MNPGGRSAGPKRLISLAGVILVTPLAADARATVLVLQTNPAITDGVALPKGYGNDVNSTSRVEADGRTGLYGAAGLLVDPDVADTADLASRHPGTSARRVGRNMIGDSSASRPR